MTRGGGIDLSYRMNGNYLYTVSFVGVDCLSSPSWPCREQDIFLQWFMLKIGRMPWTVVPKSFAIKIQTHTTTTTWKLT